MSRAARHAATLAVVFCVSGPLPAADETLSRETIAKRAKAATALVWTSLAFCVNSSGLFVTNEHVVRASSETVKLVLNPNLKTQRTLKAKIVRRDKTLDLALLKVEGGGQFEALELGSDKELSELMELVACGYPFEAAWAPRSQRGLPAISILVGSVTSLRRDKDGELHRIQLDAALDPRDSGGPVLDRSGKVVGMVARRTRRLADTLRTASRVNLAIPVSHIRRFLARPKIVFTPPMVKASNQHQQFEFTAKVVSFLPSKQSLDLELVLGASPAKERRFAMKFSDGAFRAKAVPFPALAVEAKTDPPQQVTAIPCAVVARHKRVEVGRFAATVCVQDLCRAVPPRLLSPASGALLGNSQPQDGGPYVWEFSWSEVPGAKTYHLYVIGAHASLPLINTKVNSLSYRHIGGGVILGEHLKGWSWKVRSRVNGRWSGWSEVRKFDVREPQR